MKKELFFSLLTFIVLSLNAQQNAPLIAGTNGTLTVTTTTASPSIVKANPNVLAFWIEDAAGNLINTMRYNTTNSMSDYTDLQEWAALVGKWVNSTVNPNPNPNLKINVDATTGATLAGFPANIPKTAFWGKTVSLSSVPDGVYTVKLEMANGLSGIGLCGYAIDTYSFTKGPTTCSATLVSSIIHKNIDVNAGTYTLASPSNCFNNTTINWVPVPTALDKVAYDNLFSVYPNPTRSTAFVNGIDIKKLEILTIDNKTLLKSTNTNINLTSLNPGTYLLRIYTAKDIVVKKIVKE